MKVTFKVEIAIHAKGDCVIQFAKVQTEKLPL